MPKTNTELLVLALIIFTAGIISGFNIISATSPESYLAAAALSQDQSVVVEPPFEPSILHTLNDIDPSTSLKSTDDLLAAPLSE